MKNTLIEPSVVRAAMEQFDVTDLNNGSIRQIGGIVKTIEERTGEEFVHLEMGVPGLPPERWVSRPNTPRWTPASHPSIRRCRVSPN